MTITAGFTGTVLRSRWPEVAIPPMSLPQFLLAAAADRGDRPALIDGLTGRVTSYGQFAALVGRVAAGFAARGLRKGQVVAILAPNCPDWLITAYGAMTAGGVVTGINLLYTPAEVAGQLSGSGARFLVTIPGFLSTARAAIQQTGGAVETRARRACTWHHRVRRAARPRRHTARRHHRPGGRPRAAAVLQWHERPGQRCPAHPSGLRGQRAAATRRVLLLHRRPRARGGAVLPRGRLRRDRHAALHAGDARHAAPVRDRDVPAAVQDHRITQTVVVPPIVLALAKHPTVDRYDLSSLEWLGCGAAPLGAELQQACAERIGCPGRAGLRDDRADRRPRRCGRTGHTVLPGAVGALLPGVRARIVDPDHGRRISGRARRASCGCAARR